LFFKKQYTTQKKKSMRVPHVKILILFFALFLIFCTLLTSQKKFPDISRNKKFPDISNFLDT